MHLFGREVSGFAKALVILAAIFLVASGMCGMQAIVGGFPDDSLLWVGLLALIGFLSAVGILMILLAWLLRSLIDDHAGAGDSGLQKLMDSDEQDKNDDEK
jgi:hypothetical protein